MNFTDEEKAVFLKAFTKLLKNANGKGPKNIFLKYFSDEIHVVINGLVSDFEKYLIKNFGQEAINIFSDFYQRDSKNVEKTFLSNLDSRYDFEIYELDTDFINDLFIYKMRIKL